MHEAQPPQQQNPQQQQQQYFNGKHIQLVKIRLRQTCDYGDENNCAGNYAPSHVSNPKNSHRADGSNVNTKKNSNQFLNNEIFYI